MTLTLAPRFSSEGLTRARRQMFDPAPLYKPSRNPDDDDDDDDDDSDDDDDDDDGDDDP